VGEAVNTAEGRSPASPVREADAPISREDVEALCSRLRERFTLMRGQTWRYVNSDAELDRRAADALTALLGRVAVLEDWAEGPNGVRWYIDQLAAEKTRADKAEADCRMTAAQAGDFQRQAESALIRLAAAEADRDALKDERERLARALEPFARYAAARESAWRHKGDGCHYGTADGVCVTYGDFRRAAQVIEGL
jgi:hypothetical protein